MRDKVPFIILCVAILTMLAAGNQDTRVGGIPAGYGDPLMFGHLVVRGTVANVATETIAIAEWREGGSNPNALMDITVIRVTVDEVLKGNHSDGHLAIYVPFPTKRFTLGQHIIVTTFIRGDFRGGQYQVRNLSDVLVLDNDHWVRATDGKTITLEEIRARISKTQIENVAREAEVIIVGKVLSKRERKITGDAGTPEQYEEYTLKVQRVLKGDVSEAKLAIVTMTRGLYFPAWRTYCPTHLEEGEIWYAFLKKGELGYYPSAGMNGLFKVEGDRLIYDRTVRYPHSKHAVDEIVVREVSHED